MAGPRPLTPEAIDIFRRADALGLSQKAMADALDLEPNKISKMRTGERRFQAGEILRAIEWLDGLETGASRPKPDHQPTRTVDAGETVAVMRMDLSYAMGPGTDIDHDYIEGEAVMLDLAFLRRLTPSAPSMIRIVNGVGDSMFPTIHDSEDLVLDLGQRTLNLQDRIWALSLYGVGAVKRLKAIGRDRVLVISDNPDVSDQEVDVDDIMLVGRIVGSIRRH